jgi:hypothetical protein
MADKTITALTGASTPLAGTEVLPIVQGGATVKVAVSDLTAGRAVSATVLTSTVAVGTAPLVVTSTTNVANLNASSLGGATFAAPGAIGGGTASAITGTTIAGTDATDASSITAAALKTAGGLAVVKKIYIGDNIVPAAAKGVNFTANTPKAGMTSQLLNWYEEGTWTPTLGGNTTYTRQQGRYIRNGKMCTVMASVVVNVLGTGSINTISGLPFNSALISIGGASVSYFESIATNLVSIFGRLGQNDSYIEFTGISAAATNPNQGNIFGNSTQLDFSATYIIQ